MLTGEKLRVVGFAQSPCERRALGKDRKRLRLGERVRAFPYSVELQKASAGMTYRAGELCIVRCASAGVVPEKKVWLNEPDVYLIV